MDGNAPAPVKPTGLQLKAEVVCAYVEAGGNIVETITQLAYKGIKIGRKRIDTIVRTDPAVVEWTKKAFDKDFSATCGNRLEATSAISIQRGNENKFALVDKIFLLWYAEIRRIKNPQEKIQAFANFVKAADTSAIKQNLVYSRFRDGLHAKQGPLLHEDNSQHKTDIVNVGDGRIPDNLETIEILRAHVDRLKPVNRVAAIPVNGQGDNGAAP